MDWRKDEKNFYLPKTEPGRIDIPSFGFFTVKGQGNPNDKAFGEYISVLYSLSYAVKMSPKKGKAPLGYTEYKVYPLEGIWDITEEAKKRPMEKLDKDALVFNLMIRQPSFVSQEYAASVIESTKKNKPHPLLELARFEYICEGDCVQMLHNGSYDSEPVSFRMMEEFCEKNGYKRLSKIHREIYLSDARKVSPDKLKTVLRFNISSK